MFEDTPLIMIEDNQAVADLAKRLADAPVLGVDTESDSFYSYQEKVCLIQISDLDTDYIIDPLRCDDLSPLKPLFADPTLPKVLHGADYDIVCLRRDFDFKIRNVFDTLIAAQLLGMERIGLADLITRYFGIELDKAFQRHDWSVRPLLPEHLEYARGDTHWLPALRLIMTRQLREVGRMRHMREECKLLEKRKWQPREFDPDGYLRMKQVNTLDDRSKRILRRLYIFRDATAKKLNRPVFKVIPDAVLIRVAADKPRSAADLDRIFRGKTAMKRRYGKSLIDCVVKGLEDDFPIPRPTRPKRKRTKGPRARLRGRQAEKALNELKEWRNERVEHTDGLTPYLVASNSTLKAIAQVRPHNLDELHLIPDVRRWQVDDFGDEILQVLERVDPIDG